MKNNILQNLKTYIAGKEAHGGVVSEQIKNLVKFGKLSSEEENDEHIESSYESMYFDCELTLQRSVNETVRATQLY